MDGALEGVALGCDAKTKSLLTRAELARAKPSRAPLLNVMIKAKSPLTKTAEARRPKPMTAPPLSVMLKKRKAS